MSDSIKREVRRWKRTNQINVDLEAEPRLGRKAATAAPGRHTPCRSCGASISWLKLASGKAHPIDADSADHIVPRKGGPVRGVTADGRVISGDPSHKHSGAVRVWRSHFATCPNAAAHRKAGAS